MTSKFRTLLDENNDLKIKLEKMPQEVVDRM
jgi:hypothetical protein